MSARRAAHLLLRSSSLSLSSLSAAGANGKMFPATSVSLMQTGRFATLPSVACADRCLAPPAAIHSRVSPALRLAAAPQAALLASQRRRQTGAAPRRGVGTQAMSNMAAPEAIDEVDWSPELCNTIYLLGRTGQDFELKYLENGNILGRVSVAINEPNGQTMWVNLEVWGPLAEVAASTVSKGRTIAIQGRMKIRNWVTKDGQKRTSTSVAVNQMKLVRPNPQYTGGQGQGQQQGQGQAPPPPQSQQAPPRQASPAPTPGPAPAAPRPTSSAKPGAADLDAQWAAYFQNPDAYYDNRDLKKTGERSPRYPDFKHKDSGDALWLDSYNTPAWVPGAMADLTSQQQGLDSLQDLSPF
eukprot:jgi/Tetstr1/457176/TSEL_043826.t2